MVFSGYSMDIAGYFADFLVFSTYIHTYVCTCIRTHIHTYVCMYVCTYIHTYIRMYVRMYIHTYTHTYIHTYFTCVGLVFYSKGRPRISIFGPAGRKKGAFGAGPGVFLGRAPVLRAILAYFWRGGARSAPPKGIFHA